jgi:hypothetical protein
LPVASDKEHPSQKANKQKRTVVVVLVPQSPARGAARARGGWGRQWLKPLPEVPPARAVVVVVAAVAALLPKLPSAEARA